MTVIKDSHHGSKFLVFYLNSLSVGHEIQLCISCFFHVVPASELGMEHFSFVSLSIPAWMEALPPQMDFQYHLLNSQSSLLLCGATDSLLSSYTYSVLFLSSCLFHWSIFPGTVLYCCIILVLTLVRKIFLFCLRVLYYL